MGGRFCPVFALYDLPVEAVGYAVLLGSAGTALMGVVDFLLWRRRWRALRALVGHVTLGLEDLPQAGGSIEAAYQDLLEILYRDRQALVSGRTGSGGRWWSTTPSGAPDQDPHRRYGPAAPG